MTLVVRYNFGQIFVVVFMHFGHESPFNISVAATRKKTLTGWNRCKQKLVKMC